MALKSKSLDKVRPEVPTGAVVELVRVNLNVPAATRQAWKQLALSRRMSLSDLIVEAMSKYSDK